DKVTGKTLYYEGSVREITETVKRLKLEEQFSKLMREGPGALFQISRPPGQPTVVNYISPGFERITGISVAELTERPEAFLSGIPAEERKAYGRLMGEKAANCEPWDIEHQFIDREGQRRWLRVSATPEIRDGCVTWHGYMSDVTLRKSNEIAVRQLAYFDTLTGLPNRRAFMDRMGQAIERCCERGQRGALLFIDLDNFKSLNDTHGHDI